MDHLVGTSRPVSLLPSPARQALEAASRCGVVHDTIIDPSSSGQEHTWSAWTHHTSCAHVCRRLVRSELPSTLLRQSTILQQASSSSPPSLFEHILLCGHTVTSTERACSENCRQPVCLPVRRGRHTCRFCGRFRADHRFLAWFWGFRARSMEMRDDLSLLDQEFERQVALLESEAFMFVDWLGDRSIWNLLHAHGKGVVDVAFVCCLRTIPGAPMRIEDGGSGADGGGNGNSGDTGAAFWSRPYEPWVDGWSRVFSPEPSEASVRRAWETEDNGSWQSLHRIVRFIGSSPADWRVHNPPRWSDESLIPPGREANWVVSSSIPDIVEEDAAPLGLWNDQSDSESDLGGVAGSVGLLPAFVPEHSHVEIPIQRAIFVPGRRLMMKRPAFKLRVLHRIRRTMNTAQWREDYRMLAAEQANRHDRIQVLVDFLIAPSVERAIDALIGGNEEFQQEITDRRLDPSNLDIEELTDLLLENPFLLMLLMHPERFHDQGGEVDELWSDDDDSDGDDDEDEEGSDNVLAPNEGDLDVVQELDDFVLGWQSATASFSDMLPDEVEMGLTDTGIWTFGSPGYDDRDTEHGPTLWYSYQNAAQDATQDEARNGSQDGAQDVAETEAQDNRGDEVENLVRWIVDEVERDEAEDDSHSDSNSDSDLSTRDDNKDEDDSGSEMQQDGVATHSQSGDAYYSDSLMSETFDDSDEDSQMQLDDADEDLSDV